MRLSTTICATKTTRPTTIATTRYFSIAASPSTNEPRKVVGRGERNLLRAEQRIEQLLGDDRAADRHQDLLEVLAVDGNDQHALEHEAERAADDDRRRQREREHGEIEQQRIGLRPGRQRQRTPASRHRRRAR